MIIKITVSLIGMQILRTKLTASVLMLGWMAVIYGLPLLLSGARIERWANIYLAWPLYLKLPPFIAIYLLGLVGIYALYCRHRKTWDLTVVKPG